MTEWWMEGLVALGGAAPFGALQRPPASSPRQHMSEFSISGRLMGTLGLSCTSPHDDVCMGASEGLQYLFQILVLHRRE